MLYSIVLDLRPERDALVRATLGHQAHAMFLSLVGQADASLADRFHGPGLKPFTVSSLWGALLPAEGGFAVRAGQAVGMRCTILRDDLFATFLDALLRGGERLSVRLGAAAFAVGVVHTQPAGHPWARVSSFERLLEEADTAGNLGLEFSSPTAFQLDGRRSTIFPEPRLVFGSLLARWRAFAPVELDQARVTSAAEQALVSRYQLETRMLDFGRYRKVGFVGQCQYELGPANRRTLHALADFALFAGVGYKTTMGMGQARTI